MEFTYPWPSPLTTSSNVYVTGAVLDPLLPMIMPRKYDSSGQKNGLRATTVQGIVETAPLASSLMLRQCLRDGNQRGIGTNTDYATIKYVQGPPPRPRPRTLQVRHQPDSISTASPTPTPTPPSSPIRGRTPFVISIVNTDDNRRRHQRQVPIQLQQPLRAPVRHHTTATPTVSATVRPKRLPRLAPAIHAALTCL